MDYKEAGVDRSKADSWIRSHSKDLKAAYRPEVLSDLGGFGSFFEAPKNYKDPIFCATTDGVGTKLELAELFGDEAFFGIGIDLVAMCVNDLLACKAEPLIFLDYLATAKLDTDRASHLLRGVIEGCRQASCSLVGGETAEMPGFYAGNRMDVAGFCVGVAEREEVGRPSTPQKSDVIIGFPSAGFHSNGFSLVRKILGKNLGEDRGLLKELLTPTKIYVGPLLPQTRHENVRASVHITGGGLVENLPRVLPNELLAEIDCRTWKAPDRMLELALRAGLEQRELYSTWNMGIGFCLIAAQDFEIPSGGVKIGVLKERLPEQSSVELLS